MNSANSAKCNRVLGSQYFRKLIEQNQENAVCMPSLRKSTTSLVLLLKTGQGIMDISVFYPPGRTQLIAHLVQSIHKRCIQVTLCFSREAWKNWIQLNYWQIKIFLAHSNGPFVADSKSHWIEEWTKHGIMEEEDDDRPSIKGFLFIEPP